MSHKYRASAGSCTQRSLHLSAVTFSLHRDSINDAQLCECCLAPCSPYFRIRVWQLCLATAISSEVRPVESEKPQMTEGCRLCLLGISRSNIWERISSYCLKRQRPQKSLLSIFESHPHHTLPSTPC